MRDGTPLSTELCFPDRERRSLGVLLTRTPYDKRTFRGSSSEVWRFVDAGFVVAVQDLRGTFEPEGECRVSVHERADGCDTVAWRAPQPWSNGRASNCGCSHRGEVQCQLAAARPPGLACAIVQSGASVVHGETEPACLHAGGAVSLGIAAWYRRWQKTVRPRFPPGTDGAPIRQASPFQPLAPVLEELRYPEDLYHAVLPDEPGCDGFHYDSRDPVATSGGVMGSPGEPPAIPVGPVLADLQVRSSAADIDFTAELTYMTPDGRALWMTEGILRLRCRAGLDAAGLATPGTVVPIRIDMKATVFRIERGPRLRLEVPSGDSCRFERNLDTGGRNYDECTPVVACSEVPHSVTHPSRLRLWLEAA